MTHLVSRHGPGLFLKWFFKLSVLFYKIGLPLFDDFILLLTTTGRKSGKPRQTPLEYRCEPGTGYKIITAGWCGNTDWRKNILADPNVKVQVGRYKYEAVAEPLSVSDVADWMTESIRINPVSIRMFSRWAGEQVNPEDRANLLRAAGHFPAFRIIPKEDGEPH